MLGAMNKTDSTPQSVPSPQTSTPAAPKRQLTLFDSTSIIVGIIIGAGIYESTPLIAKNVPDLGGLLLAWLLGGFCSLVGALCYAELATAYPKAGGDYVYLTRAFGRQIGFLFACFLLPALGCGSNPGESNPEVQPQAPITYTLDPDTQVLIDEAQKAKLSDYINFDQNFILK